MYNDEIYFDEIKREVLPDGRIRYYAEKIVHEIDIEAPRTESEIAKRFRESTEPFREAIIKEISGSDPYLNLMEGSDMASKRT